MLAVWRPCSSSGRAPSARIASTTAPTRPRTRRETRPRTARTSTTSWRHASRSPARTVGISRLNALLTSYLFLLWFDTRSGYQDTGPYALGDGRVLLLRRYNRLGVSHFPWSAAVGRRAAVHRGARRIRAPRRRAADHRLRDVGDEARGLLAPRRVVRLLRRRGGRARRRSGAAGRDALGLAAKSCAEAALPQDRGHGAFGQDRRRRVRVLHVPASVRRARGRRRSTGPCRWTASTCTRSFRSSTARSTPPPTRRSTLPRPTTPPLL